MEALVLVEQLWRERRETAERANRLRKGLKLFAGPVRESLRTLIRAEIARAPAKPSRKGFIEMAVRAEAFARSPIDSGLPCGAADGASLAREDARTMARLYRQAARFVPMPA